MLDGSHFTFYQVCVILKGCCPVRDVGNRFNTIRLCLAHAFMAHPEPSTPPADNPAASDPSWPSRHSRIHFPKDDSSPARRESSAPDHRRGTSLSFRSSPARRTSPLNPQNALSSVNARRRVRSVDASSVFVDSPRSRRVPANPLASPSRMSPSLARETEDHLMGLFSDEYDLCE